MGYANQIAGPRFELVGARARWDENVHVDSFASDLFEEQGPEDVP